MKEAAGSMWIGWVDLQSAAVTEAKAVTAASTVAAGLHNNKGGCWFIVGRVTEVNILL